MATLIYAEIDAFHADDKAIEFTAAPTEVHGQRIARFRDCEGAERSVAVPDTLRS